MLRGAAAMTLLSANGAAATAIARGDTRRIPLLGANVDALVARGTPTGRPGPIVCDRALRRRDGEMDAAVASPSL